MKAILEFNLPEDSLEYKQVTKSNDMANALWDITHNTKKQLHYISEGEEQDKGIDLVFNKIYEILEDNNINTDELC